MSEDLLLVTKEIKNVYNKLKVNKLDSKYELIEELKELINQENELYSYLSFEELCEIRYYFDNNDTKYNDISKRIINKIDNIIMKKYFDEYYFHNSERLKHNKNTEKSIIFYIYTLKRDILYLNLFYLNKFINKNGDLGDKTLLKIDELEEYKYNILFNNCFILPNVESELIDNNFIINDFYLNNNLVKQIYMFSDEFCKEINDIAFLDDFDKYINQLFSIHISNFNEGNNKIILLESLINILSISLLDDNYIIYTEYLLSCNKINTFIYYLLKDNIDDLTNDKMTINTLSLNNRKK